MKLPIQSQNTHRLYDSQRASFIGIKPSLPPGGGGLSPRCTCIRHGDSSLWECCKIGSEDCRGCVGETISTCCRNLHNGVPSPVPIPPGLILV